MKYYPELTEEQVKIIRDALEQKMKSLTPIESGKFAITYAEIIIALYSKKQKSQS